MVTFVTPNRHGYSVQFSPFGSDRLAVATSQYFGLTGGGTLFLLEIKDDQLVELLNVQWSDGLFDVTWSENNPNHIVSAAGDGSLQLWDLLNTPVVPITTFSEHKKEVYSVEWSQNRHDQWILSASWDKTIKLWDPNRQASLNTFCGHTQLVYSASFSPLVSNCFASVSGDGTLKLWNCLDAQNPSLSFPVHDAEALSLDWCKYDEHLITTSGSDGLIRGWDLRNYAQPIFQLKGGDYAVRKVRFSPHKMNILASVSYDFTTRIWDFKKSCDAIEVIKHHSEFVYGLDWNTHRQGQLADCGWDSLVHVFTPNSVKTE